VQRPGSRRRGRKSVIDLTCPSDDDDNNDDNDDNDDNDNDDNDDNDNDDNDDNDNVVSLPRSSADRSESYKANARTSIGYFC
jgi:hypothetical protein